jgi:hypothetical protein
MKLTLFRMQWIVDGTDRVTGNDRRITIEATDADDAERQAVALGLLVNTVAPITVDFNVVAGLEPSTRAASPIDYASNREADGPPALLALRIMCGIVEGFALLALIGGCAMLLLALLAAVTTGWSGSTQVRIAGDLATGSAFVSGLSLLLTGAILGVIGTGGNAIRSHIRRHWTR